MKGVRDLDTHFDSIQKELSPAVLQLLEVPHYAEVGRNLVSMGNYLPLLEPLMVALTPKKICEIGAYRGISTRALAELAAKNSGELMVVDPAIIPGEAPYRSDFISYFQMLSEEFLSTPRDVDLYLIDGDHNYEVVSTELRLIMEVQCTSCYPILLMHDTGWPCAFRDMYYEISRIKQKHPVLSHSILSLTKSEACEIAISLPIEVDVAETEGGPRNGVRTAILDFVAAYPGWKFIHLPSLYGLGVVWNDVRVSGDVSRALRDLENLFTRIGPFLAILELNRLILLSELHEQGEEWRKNQDYIAAVDKRIKDLVSRVSHLESASGAFKQLVKCAFSDR